MRIKNCGFGKEVARHVTDLLELLLKSLTHLENVARLGSVVVVATLSGVQISSSVAPQCLFLRIIRLLLHQ